MKRAKRFLKKGLALFMAAAAVLSGLPPVTASAATEYATIVFANCLDSSGSMIYYQQTYTNNGQVCARAGEAKTRIYADGENAYCLEPEARLRSGDTLHANASDAWDALSSDQKDAVNLALLYGAQGNLSGLSGSEDEKVAATQTLVWELTTGERDAKSPYTLHDSRFFDGLCAGGANRGVSAAYNEIVDLMKDHARIPSFASDSRDSAAKELKWDGEKYVLKVKDENGVLSKFDFTSPDSRVEVSASGNTLTITSNQAIKDEVCLSATKKVPTVSSSARLLAYGDPSLQDVLTGVENTEAVHAYLNVKLPYGHLRIVKTSEDGIVEGLRFQVTGDSVNQTVETGKDGSIKVENLNPGTYTVTELTEERYETQKSQKVTVAGGETAEVTFSNTLKHGGLKVTKSSEDGFVEGVKFHLYGTSLSGAAVDAYAVTDGSGVAAFSNILISGAEPYTLEEVDTAIRYVVPAGQEVTVRWNEVTEAAVTNVLKKFRVHVTKTDRETGEPQGGASLAGAVYGLYDGEELADTYTTDQDGQFTTDYFICGDDWSLREMTPSEGYLLDDTVYPVGAEAENYTV